MYTVILTQRARKDLRSLSQRDKTRIIETIWSLRDDPHRGKILHWVLDGCYAILVWPFRILYKIHEKIVTVEVVGIGDRKDIYEKAARRLRQPL